MRFLTLRWLAVALLASALAGCVTTQNTLTKADVAALKLADVRVSVAPDAKIVWYEPLQAYAATKKIPDEQYSDFIKTNDAKAHVNGLISGKVKGAMEKKVAGQLNGSRPVRIEVVVTQFIVPTAAQRVIIGGSNRHDRRRQCRGCENRRGHSRASEIHLVGPGRPGDRRRDRQAIVNSRCAADGP